MTRWMICTSVKPVNSLGSFFFSFCPSKALCSHVRPWPAESLSREVNHLAISVSEAPCSLDDSSADWPNWTPVYGAITLHCFLYGTQIVVLRTVAWRRQYLCGLALCAGFDSLLTYPTQCLFISDEQQAEYICLCVGDVMLAVINKPNSSIWSTR